MSNVVTLRGGMRWKAVIEYSGPEGSTVTDHYFEELSELQKVIEHGPDWNSLIRCTITLNRSDDGAEQQSAELAVPRAQR